jgi:hypothetical protein
MTVSLLEQMVAGEAPPLLELDVQQYHDMIRTGILPECAPIELIDGLLVWKDRSFPGANFMSHDPRHTHPVKQFLHVQRRLEPLNFHVQLQMPVTLSAKNEPEPDIAIIRGTSDQYAKRHPGPADIAAAIEVAASSLKFDRTTKQQKYASAAIPQYWIVNVVEDQIEVYEEPLTAEGRYGRRTDYRRGQTIRLVLDADKAIEIHVSEILPPP